MRETRYMISDASKKIDVEPHVLRYWEEELDITIPRNELGHRYYRQQDLDVLKTVKCLKEQGFQLRAIKMLLPDIEKIEKLDPKDILRLREELNEQVAIFDEMEAEEETFQGRTSPRKEEVSIIEKKAELIEDTVSDKIGQFQKIMNNLILNALQENNEELTRTVSDRIVNSVIKEIDYMLRIKEEEEEERFKQLDETIRCYQKNRQEAAASIETTKKKKSFFRKK